MLNIVPNARKVDKDLYNNSAEQFIPIACHYDANTLLTKNGELLQTIQINGINSENISDKLFNLRDVVRSAISKNVTSKKFAFWIHTVRRKTNLDDTTPYNKLLPANIHHIWRQKNYWDDKFVNTLYISIIYDSAELKIKNFNSFFNSLFFKVLENFQNQYLDQAHKKLSSTVDAILSDLQSFGAVKLGIRFEGEESYSDLMFLYRRIIHLNEEYCLVPITNLANALASSQYAVGSDKMEVISGNGKRFASILSIKEYQEVSSAALDGFLQLPLELIATEIFYFVGKKEVVKAFEHQAYICEVSKDKQIAEITGIDKIMNLDEAIPNQYCKQQISIAIIESDLSKLDQSIARASEELAKIGIVHVREDINLEQTFWAQLPGNFSFVRRMAPTIIGNTAALASLHNFPTGNQYNKWGKAVTLLRTEKGTPFFMNFHPKGSNRGNTCIFGANKTGKTVMTNFLLSEATKYDPTILYLSNNEDSKIFIEALEGEWSKAEQNVINPFILDDNTESRLFTKEFLKIICNHYFAPLTELELAFLEKFTDKIFSLDKNNRDFATILKVIDFTLEGGETIKTKLSDYTEGGLYDGVLGGENFSLQEKGTKGINLYSFSTQSFTERFYPTDQKLVTDFFVKLTVHNSLCAALVYALSYNLTLIGEGVKILTIDNLDSLCRPDNFSSIMQVIADKLETSNGIIISNFNYSYIPPGEKNLLQSWLELTDTKIVLPSDVTSDSVGNVLNLKETELVTLSKFALSSRMFLINQGSDSIVVELSIGSLVGIIKILSASELELEIYQEVLKKYPGHPDDWINQLYKELSLN